jgi:flagellin
MGLRIQNNIAAMNAHRQLSISDAGMSKSLERLSSGFRINKAADDAAGLSISQSFRADIASFKVASRNTTEANALLQVAEGALDQVGNMLTRLKELATQAASANSGSNLTKIDSEAQKLIDEIDRIATSTEYAQTKLINGSYGVTINGGTAGVFGSSGSGFAGISGLQTSEHYNIATAAGGAAGSVGTMTMTSGAGSETVYFTKPGTGSTTSVYFSLHGVTVTTNSSADALDGKITSGATGNSAFQVGAENQSDNRITISLGNARTSSSGLNLDSVVLTSASAAQNALDSIDTAISSLNTTRGDVGAYMNRLSYAASNVATTIENIQAAESVIRDVDMAAEMTTFTKNQILLQAGTAMLAQANMAPQQVLSLFG